MFTCNYTMSVTCSLSESSSGCSSADVPAGLFPFGLLDSNAFPFSTQPIVYYAELPELYGKKQKGQEKKNKRNHFVKAFHWYKRDHCASKKTAVETFDIGFATWLDHKYQQYLRDRSRNASFKSEVSNVQTPTVNQNVGSYKSTKPKGLRRILKSPWRKRHAVDNTLEEGHCCTECKESWQTILRPKSLSRFESENCTQKRSNGASSKITVTSSDTQVVIKSNKRDLIVQEITPRSDDASYLDKNISDKETPNIDELFSKKKLGKKKRNKSKIIKCECPVEENEIASNYKTDTVTLTQYDPNINIAEKPLKNATRTNVISKSGVLYKSTELMTPIATTNSYAARSKETIVLRKRKTDSEIDIKCECPAGSNESNNHYKQDMSVQHDQNNKDEETKRLENSTTTQVTIKPDFTNKSTGAISPKHEDRPKHIVCKCPMPFADEAAQTSDYAITPGRVTSGLPLFLRVVSTR
ncbi:uncharacterized protein LOC133519538 [Cydia pomonella]|uniref:uncharacterized protein LOC133519538 n=1 Tax=Cydia pomonella TaxID=82600 RepID=UPI002ADD553D|nr:uncharacterized protein LOC133519538 [Cydia pomonella]